VRWRGDEGGETVAEGGGLRGEGAEVPLAAAPVRDGVRPVRGALAAGRGGRISTSCSPPGEQLGYSGRGIRETHLRVPSSPNLFPVVSSKKIARHRFALNQHLRCPTAESAFPQ